MTADVEHHHSHEETEHIHGEHCDHDHDDHSDVSGEDEDFSIHNRNEKKARKLFSKLGLKPIAGIERVTIKRGRLIFAIANPTVYHTAAGYVVFGEAKVEDPAFQAQAMAAQRMAQAQKESIGADKGKEAANGDSEQVEENGDDGEEVDMEGLDVKDVNIVMEQTGVSRSKAVKALRANGNDIVNTIMELTM